MQMPTPTPEDFNACADSLVGGDEAQSVSVSSAAGDEAGAATTPAAPAQLDPWERRLPPVIDGPQEFTQPLDLLTDHEFEDARSSRDPEWPRGKEPKSWGPTYRQHVFPEQRARALEVLNATGSLRAANEAGASVTIPGNGELAERATAALLAQTGQSGFGAFPGSGQSYSHPAAWQVSDGSADIFAGSVSVRREGREASYAVPFPLPANPRRYRRTLLGVPPGRSRFLQRRQRTVIREAESVLDAVDYLRSGLDFRAVSDAWADAWQLRQNRHNINAVRWLRARVAWGWADPTGGPKVREWEKHCRAASTRDRNDTILRELARGSLTQEQIAELYCVSLSHVEKLNKRRKQMLLQDEKLTNIEQRLEEVVTILLAMAGDPVAEAEQILEEEEAGD